MRTSRGQHTKDHAICHICASSGILLHCPTRLPSRTVDKILHDDAAQHLEPPVLSGRRLIYESTERIMCLKGHIDFVVALEAIVLRWSAGPLVNELI